MKTVEDALSYFVENYPLLKIVKYDDMSQLFYDARANMMFFVNNEDLPIVADYLQNHDKESILHSNPNKEGINDIIIRIDGLQNKGVLLPGPVDYLISTEHSNVEDHIKYNFENILMRKFVLETTQQCNFRCKYCFNTIETEYRHHTNKQMSLSVAKAAVDFYKDMYLKFYNKLPEDKKKLLLKHFEPSIGFYGGETSLNWDLVEKAYDYFVNLDWDKAGIKREDLRFTINTNLYILTEKMLSFILENKPILFVSLDGPKEDNDRNRVTVDGKGTFDRVYANLLRIKETDPEYFRTQVMVLCVEATGNNKKAVHDFLDSIGCLIEYMQEQPYGLMEKDPDKQISDIEETEQTTIEHIIDKYKKRVLENDPDAVSEFESLYFLDNVERDTPFSFKNMSISLTCPLCVDNIMIDTDGGMHLCHKTDGSLPLGNVCDGGYDMKKMFDAYKSYGETTNCLECRSCWAVNSCGYCAAQRLHGGKWLNPKKIECDLHRRYTEFLLKLFVAVYKLDPDIFSRLMDRKHNLVYYKSIVDYNEFIHRNDEISKTQL